MAPPRAKAEPRQAKSVVPDLSRVEGPLAIIAGGGVLPISIAEAALASGHDVRLVGICGEADKAIARFPHA